jgi:hypothetical protein
MDPITDTSGAVHGTRRAGRRPGRPVSVAGRVAVFGVWLLFSAAGAFAGGDETSGGRYSLGLGGVAWESSGATADGSASTALRLEIVRETDSGLLLFNGMFTRGNGLSTLDFVLGGGWPRLKFGTGVLVHSIRLEQYPTAGQSGTVVHWATMPVWAHWRVLDTTNLAIAADAYYGVVARASADLKTDFILPRSYLHTVETSKAATRGIGLGALWHTSGARWGVGASYRFDQWRLGEARVRIEGDPLELFGEVALPAVTVRVHSAFVHVAWLW